MALRTKLLVLLVTVCHFVGSGCRLDRNAIVRVSRQSNSGTFAYFRETVVGPQRELKLGSLDLSGSKDVVEMVAVTPNAIGFSGMGYANSRVKMLRLGSHDQATTAPTKEAVMRGAYPLARKLYIYVVGEPQGAVRHYLEWIHSEEGQLLVEQLGYVRYSQTREEMMPANPSAASIKIAGSDTMVNLSQAWAEEYSRKFPQVRPEVAGGGTGVGIAKLIDGTVQMANASREMKPEEKRQVLEKFGLPVQEYVVALDALAVFVHSSNPVDELSLDQLAEIFGDRGTITRWSQLQRQGT